MSNTSFKAFGLYIQFLILAAVVLAIFYPTIHAEVSLVDDADMLGWLRSSESGLKRLQQIVIPGGAQGGYYRPLIGISFLLDKIIHGADPLLMHLEGVLFHLVNVLLVFFLARECLALPRTKPSPLSPFFAALLFGLHPITTESVNWISGRTDIMMGNFVLLGSILLVRYRRIGGVRYLFAGLIAFLLGALAKETAFACLAGGALICTAQVAERADNLANPSPDKAETPLLDLTIFYGIAFLSALLLGNYWIVLVCCAGYWLVIMYRRSGRNSLNLRSYIKPLLIVAGVAFFSVLLFVLLRRFAFTSDAGKISNTIRLMIQDPNYSISLFTGAFGFYIQKFIFPWPLNFFILEIDPLYDLAGIAVLLVMVRLLTINTISTALFFAGAGLLLPVLPLVFGTIAWSSYAERYLYLPSAFWCAALAVQSARFVEVGNRFNPAVIRWTFAPALLIITAVFSITTWQRNVIWQKNVTLLRDTVDKSPRVKPLRDFYMAALFQVGRYEEAAEQYQIGRSLFSRTYDPAPDLMMGMILQNRQKYDEAYRLYERANAAAGFRSEPLLNAMISFLEASPADSASSAFIPQPEIQRYILLYRSKLNKLRENKADRLPIRKGSQL